MPAPPYASGTSMPIRPSWPISRMFSSGNSPFASSSAATGTMRFCAKSRAIDWIDSWSSVKLKSMRISGKGESRTFYPQTRHRHETRRHDPKSDGAPGWPRLFRVMRVDEGRRRGMQPFVRVRVQVHHVSRREELVADVLLQLVRDRQLVHFVLGGVERRTQIEVAPHEQHVQTRIVLYRRG